MIKRFVVTKYRISSPYLVTDVQFDDLSDAREKSLALLCGELTRKIMAVIPSTTTAYAVAEALAGDTAKAQETLDLFKDLAGPCIDE